MLLSCQYEPSVSSLNNDYLVYTAHDTSLDFSTLSTFSIPDSILIINSGDSATYWSGEDALTIINKISSELQTLGYMEQSAIQSSDFGVQISYLEQSTYFVGSSSPYWWYDYPYYWAPGYWGARGGYYYPYDVYYGYTAGSLLIELVDIASTMASADQNLMVVWTTFIGGILSSSEVLNEQRTLSAIDEAFDQSPYLSK